MKFQKIFFLVLIFLGLYTKAQDSIYVKPLASYPAELLKTDEYGNKYYYDERNKAKVYEINGETVVMMDELTLATKPRFNNQLDRNYY